MHGCKAQAPSDHTEMLRRGAGEHSRTERPSTGCTQSGATSRSGQSTKARADARGDAVAQGPARRGSARRSRRCRGRACAPHSAPPARARPVPPADGAEQAGFGLHGAGETRDAIHVTAAAPRTAPAPSRTSARRHPADNQRARPVQRGLPASLEWRAPRRAGQVRANSDQDHGRQITPRPLAAPFTLRQQRIVLT